MLSLFFKPTSRSATDFILEVNLIKAF